MKLLFVLYLASYSCCFLLSFLTSTFQLRLRAREQDAVPDFKESDRRGVPGAADHQLGRHRVGGQAGSPVGRGTLVGKHQSHRGSPSRLSRIQGQSVSWFSLKKIG